MGMKPGEKPDEKPDDGKPDDVEEGESDAEAAVEADKAAKLKEERLRNFRKKWVPREEHEKTRAELANLKNEKEIDDDSGSGDPAGKKPAGQKPAPAEEEGKAERERGFIFPFPHKRKV